MSPAGPRLTKKNYKALIALRRARLSWARRSCSRRRANAPAGLLVVYYCWLMHCSLFESLCYSKMEECVAEFVLHEATGTLLGELQARGISIVHLSLVVLFIAPYSKLTVREHYE